MKFRNLDIATIDVETFYSTHYSLKNLGTSLYVFDDQFLLHGASILLNEVNTYYYGKDSFKKALDKIDWSKTALLGHHTHFDGLVLRYHFGIVPVYYLDTLSMARPILMSQLKSLNLDMLAKHFGCKGKLAGLEDTKGKRELTTNEKVRLAIYCKNDTMLTEEVYKHLVHLLPDEELDIIDWHVRAYADGEFIVNGELARSEIIKIKAEKEILFQKVQEYFPENLLEMDIMTVLRSSILLDEVIKHNGFDTPKKISKTTNLQTFAFAKTDLEFTAFKHLPDPAPLLYEARVKAKSDTILNKAILLDQFSNYPPMPIYMNYCSAITGRSTGSDKINVLNFSRKSTSRQCLTAPPGHKVISIDSSGIELRTSLWLSNDQEKLDAIKRGEDLYIHMATNIYNKDYKDITNTERSIGKVAILSCLGADTMVLCDSGIKPIIDITPKDKVWNGNKYVKQKGMIYRGLKKTLNVLGISITPNHLVLSGTEWKPAKHLLQDENILCQILDTGAENLPLQDIYEKGLIKDLKDCLLHVRVLTKNILSTHITSNISKQLGAKNAELNTSIIKTKCTGDTQTFVQMMSIVEGYLVEFLQQHNDATIQKINYTLTMENVELQCKTLGEKINAASLNTLYHFLDGIIPTLKWTESIMTEDIQREILDLLLNLKMQVTDAACMQYSQKYQNSKEKTILSEKKIPVYDLLECEEGNRFTVITNKGPIIVHNCQYGAGLSRFMTMLKEGTLGPPILLPDTTVSHIHSTFRTVYAKTVDTWALCKDILPALCVNTSETHPDYKLLKFTPGKVHMPNGLHLNYYDMRIDEYGAYTYKGRGGIRKHIYNTLLYNNLSQSLARNIVYHQICLVAKKYKVLHAVYDECSIIVPDADVENAKAYLMKCFKTAPSYIKELEPCLNAEICEGTFYAK